jgi:hypothetical protein
MNDYKTEVIFPESVSNPLVVFETNAENGSSASTQYVDLSKAHSIRFTRSNVTIGFSGGSISIDGVHPTDGSKVAEKWLEMQPE